MRKFLGSIRIVIASGIVYFISQIGIASIIHPIGFKNFLALQLCFSKKYTLHTFEEWKAAGLMAAYKAHFLVDFIHPFWYALFLTSSLACIFNSRKISDKWNWVLFLPVIAAICDELENSIQLFFLSGGAITQRLANFSSGFSLTKWILALGSLLIVLGLLAFKKNETRHVSA